MFHAAGSSLVFLWAFSTDITHIDQQSTETTQYRADGEIHHSKEHSTDGETRNSNLLLISYESRLGRREGVITRSVSSGQMGTRNTIFALASPFSELTR